MIAVPTSDGASTVILAADHVAKKFTDTPVWVKGSGAASDYLALHDRPSITELIATKKAAKVAYKSSSLTAKNIDLAEVHDCFTIAELLATEASDSQIREMEEILPLKERGLRNNGDVTINSSGGLKSKGHPLGATGTGQVVEIFKQLRRCRKRQTSGRCGSRINSQCWRFRATCAVHIFGRSPNDQ